MKVRDLLKELEGVDLDAEVTINAPFSASKSNPRPGHLWIPSRKVTSGKFAAGEGKGEPWVCIEGTDVWGQYVPSEEGE